MLAYFRGFRGREKRCRCPFCSNFNGSKVGKNEYVESNGTLVKIYNDFFCLSDSISKEKIPRRNDFSNFQQYFVQCEIPSSLAKIRMSSGMAPQEISRFIQNLIKYNDNTKNAYLDCYWRARLVESLANTLSRGVQDRMSDKLLRLVTFLSIKSYLNF